MASKPHLVGEVVALDQGFALRLVRYPSGRKLPRAVTLTAAHSRGVASRMALLGLLGAYTRHEVDLRGLKQLVAACAPVAVVPARAPDYLARLKDRDADLLANHAQTYEEEHQTSRSKPRKRVAKARPLPEVTKVFPERPTQVIKGEGYRAALAAEVERFLSTPKVPAGKRKAVLPTVTTCPEAVPYVRRKRGGVLPGHLNPVTIS